ncbi:MAG: class II glutamine amidotransferase, partial [Myxococcales bacterium]|nr:class II glutamine amidotransferase [Myxococcales bacterium]
GVLRDWERFRATVFLCHIRGAAKRVSQEDTHPFLRSYAGRDWLLAHSGQLDMQKVHKLPLGQPPIFEPVGRTDSEYVLCWILSQLHPRGVRRLADIGWDELHGWFRSLDRIGTFNVLMSDGHDLVAYRDGDGKDELHYLRRKPPHEETFLENRIATLDLSDPKDHSRTMLVFSTTPAGGTGWKPVEPGEMVVARRGEIIWRSTASDDAPEPGERPGRALRPSEPPPQLMRAPMADLTSMGVPTYLHLPTSDAPPPTARIASVVHETVYAYKQVVEQSSHAFRLRPANDMTQTVLEHSLEVDPDGESYSFEDVFGNHATNVRIRSPYKRLRIVGRSKVRLRPVPPVAVRTRGTTIPLVWMPWQRQMMLPYLLPAELPETQLRELSDYAMGFVERQDYDLVETLHDINTTIRRDYAYVAKSTTLETTPFDVYTHRRGVCQDFANLFICLARLLGVPARYCVGYIYTGANYENKIQSDASHAWVEVYLPWAGWRGYDPTNGCLANLDHVRVAVGRNFRDATPTAGTIYKGGEGETLKVSVRVEMEDAI